MAELRPPGPSPRSTSEGHPRPSQTDPHPTVTEAKTERRFSERSCRSSNKPLQPRNKDELTTKLHFAVDALGKPLRMILSAGQVADIECAHGLIADMPCASLVADKGYDANALVMSIEASGAQAVIPPRSNRIAPRQYDRCAYRARNLIERFFNRIKHYRRIATRYDKLACSYMAFVRIVCAVISYRYM